MERIQENREKVNGRDAAVEEIVKEFKKFDGSRNEQMLFSDWVKLTALSISQRVNYDKEMERAYLQTVKGYRKEELQSFCKMTGRLWRLFDQQIDDYLGKIYMRSGMGSNKTGQFFTPFHLSELTANLSLEDLESRMEGGKLIINEPSSGGGGLILAAAKILKEKNLNYQEIMDVTARDLDWNGVYMTYTQLSMAGIPAKIIQGDTLAGSKPLKRQILFTPMYLINAAHV